MKLLTIGMATALAVTALSPLPAQQKAGKPAQKQSVKQNAAPKSLTEEQKILHALNRLGYGPRPGDVDRVKKMGLKSWIDMQLNPERIPDDAVDAKVAAYSSLKLSGEEIAEMERNVQMSNARLKRLQSQMADRGAMAGSNAIQSGVDAAQSGAQPKPVEQARRARELMMSATPEERKMLEDGRMAREMVNQAGAQLVMNKIIRASESNRQLSEVMVDFWSNHFNIDATKVRASKVADEQQVIRPNAMGKFRDLLKASSTSAAMMLYLDNAQSTAPQAPPQRAGRGAAMMQFSFQQLKQAADRGRPQAQQMLSRIHERAMSDGISDEDAFKKLQAMMNQPAGRARGGLNENYARELMELHTLGVDGGYTQKDVTEVARCLTGWGVRGGRYSGEFEFHPRLHDSGEKVVLGKTIPAGGGIEDGQTVLEMLATHPSTMRHISTKLCRRFVSDNPPKSLVDKCVETWKKTDGDIQAIVGTIVTSPEFFSPAAYRSKIKSPFEYVVSAVRATGGTVLPQPQMPALGRFRPAALGINVFAKDGTGQMNQRLLAGQIGTLGQPLYNYGFPTGYPEESTKWVSSGALIGRINFALNLTGGKLADVDLSQSFLNDTSAEHKPVPAEIHSVAKQILGSDVSAATRATLVTQLQPDDSGADSMPLSDTRRIASLLLGSPEFQRR